MIVRVLLLLAVFAALLAVAHADVVTLTNGSVFEGTVIEDTPQRVVIEVRGGKLTFPRHLVKSVVKKALKKPPQKPARPKPKAGVLWSWPNLYRDLEGVVAIGERFDFRYTSKRGPTRERLTVTWLGLREVKLQQTFWGPKHPQGKTHPRQWSQPTPGRGWPPKDARRVTLRASGRSFPCVVLETGKDGAIKRWIHIRDGHKSFPEVIKMEVDGKVVKELTKIHPAPKTTIVPPRDPGVARGDVLTKRTSRKGKGFRTTVYTVYAACPTEVLYRTDMSKGSTTGAGWRWLPKTVVEQEGKMRLLGRETLTIDGRAYPCVVIGALNRSSDQPTRRWWHVDENGRSRFPGIVRVEFDGRVVNEVLTFERR